jgi:H+/Cl- antiporter ClcA
MRPGTSCERNGAQRFTFQTQKATLPIFNNHKFMEFNSTSFPKVLVAAGILLILLGLLSWTVQESLSWLGRLPGDIRIERENFSFYFPISTMILLSLLLTGLLWVVRRFWP